MAEPTSQKLVFWVVFQQYDQKYFTYHIQLFQNIMLMIENQFFGKTTPLPHLPQCVPAPLKAILIRSRPRKFQAKNDFYVIFM